MAIATIFAFILPNSPKTVRGHTEQEREWLAWTFGQDQGQQDHSDEITAWKGFEMATADPKTWLLMGTLYCVSITLRSLFTVTLNFFPSVVATLGYSRTKTYGLTAVSYLHERNLELLLTPYSHPMFSA
jgi:hypothetical protein